MRLTNVHNLPSPIIRALERDPYTKGDADFSITELMDSPRVRALQALHWGDLTEDASSRVMALLGRAVHKILEEGADEHDVAEQRLFAEISGYRISGAVDLHRREQDRVEIHDWKVTTAASIMRGEKAEWRMQLNGYAWLLRRHNMNPVKLTVWAFLRDWQQGKTADPSYPKSPILPIDIPLEPVEDVDARMKERLRMHVEARMAAAMGRPIPECSDADRWLDAPSYAVLKPKAKRALRVFDDIAIAKAFAADYEGALVEERAGMPKRCMGNYCKVAAFCDQFQRMGDVRQS